MRFYAVHDRGDEIEIHAFDSRGARHLWLEAQRHAIGGDPLNAMRYVHGVSAERARKMAGYGHNNKKFHDIVIHHGEDRP